MSHDRGLARKVGGGPPHPLAKGIAPLRLRGRGGGRGVRVFATRRHHRFQVDPTFPLSYFFESTFLGRVLWGPGLPRLGLLAATGLGPWDSGARRFSIFIVTLAAALYGLAALSTPGRKSPGRVARLPDPPLACQQLANTTSIECRDVLSRTLGAFV